MLSKALAVIRVVCRPVVADASVMMKLLLCYWFWLCDRGLSVCIGLQECAWCGLRYAVRVTAVGSSDVMAAVVA